MRQLFRFPQHLGQEPARLFLFDGVELCGAALTAEQAVKVSAVLAEPIRVIDEQHSLVQPNQIGCHGQVWSVRAFDALFLEYLRDGLGRVQDDVTCP